MPTTTTEEEEQFLHEHELARSKRRRGYDDITESDLGGDEE